MNDRPPRVTLLGASGDVPNLGVRALLHSTVVALHRRLPALDLVVVDTTPPLTPTRSVEVEGHAIEHQVSTARLGLRLWRLDNSATAWALQAAHLEVPLTRLLRGSDVVLDITGGDSFTDVYGTKRLLAGAFPKLIALRAHTPLVLLPQTYGEFRRSSSRRLARRIVRRAELAFARDERSFRTLRDLLGPAYDPDRHRATVDVAFGLAAATHPPLTDLLERWTAPSRTRPVVGVNVSGLLWNDPGEAARHRLRLDYRDTMLRLVRRILGDSEANVVLVPHVNPSVADAESDPLACERLVALLGAEHVDRLQIAPAFTDPSLVKGLIARMDWFVGMRMHSTIAALSTGVPTAAIAYSVKTAGVFDRCGLGANVVDGRSTATDQAVTLLWERWLDRDADRAVLARHLPDVRRELDRTFDDIADLVRARAEVAGTTA